MQCLVFGASGAGKSSLLRGLVRARGESGLGNSPADEGSPRKAPACSAAANEITLSRGHRQRAGMSNKPGTPPPPPPPTTPPPPLPKGNVLRTLQISIGLYCAGTAVSPITRPLHWSLRSHNPAVCSWYKTPVKKEIANLTHTSWSSKLVANLKFYHQVNMKNRLFYHTHSIYGCSSCASNILVPYWLITYCAYCKTATADNWLPQPHSCVTVPSVVHSTTGWRDLNAVVVEPCQEQTLDFFCFSGINCHLIYPPLHSGQWPCCHGKSKIQFIASKANS